MRRYTTPSIMLTVENADITAFSVYVTFKQRDRVITLENPTSQFVVANTILSVPLSQLQTAGFAPGFVDVQINWKDRLGNRDATDIGTIRVAENLLDEEV